MEHSVSFKEASFRKRLSSMLRVDLRRAVRSLVVYILIACAFFMPLLMTVMMSMMDGMESTNPQTNEVTILNGPENTWQNIGTLPGSETMGGMDVFAMCNINMMFMAVAVFVCLFISDDFRSGYAKNLFTVRAKRGEYVISKIIMGFLVGAVMLIAYMIGSILGGAISSLSFDLMGLSVGNLVMCLLSKIFLMLVFVSIFTLISVAAKQRAWLAICGSLGGGMLLFMTVGMISPLSATPMHVLLCLVGGVLFATGLGFAAIKVLQTTSVV